MHMQIRIQMTNINADPGGSGILLYIDKCIPMSECTELNKGNRSCNDLRLLTGMKSKVAVEKTTQAAARPNEKLDLVRDQEPSTRDTVADLRLSGNISANPSQKIISQ